MSGTSLASLVVPLTPAQNLAQLLALLQLGGFPATAWQSGSSGPVFANSEANLVADLSQVLASVAAGGVLPLPGNPSSGAQGAWLDLLGQQVFQSPRNNASFTSGQIVLTDVANAGPFPINPNALTVEDGSKTYLFASTNAVQVTLPKGGTLTLTVQAAAAGAAYNLANGAVTILVTSLPGVTVSNPAVGSTGTWITTVGTNRETDALYAQRLGNKWATLGSGSNTGAYYYNATTPSVTGSQEVVQCAVFAAATVMGGVAVNAVNVVVAGANGPISSAGLALVNAAIQAKRPLTVPVIVVNAIPSNTLFAGNVVVSPSYDPVATLAAVQVAISNVLGSIPIGGALVVDQVIAAAMGVTGVTNLSSFTVGGQPAGTQIALGNTTVATPLFTLTSSH